MRKSEKDFRVVNSKYSFSVVYAIKNLLLSYHVIKNRNHERSSKKCAWKMTDMKAVHYGTSWLRCNLFFTPEKDVSLICSQVHVNKSAFSWPRPCGPPRQRATRTAHSPRSCSQPPKEICKSTSTPGAVLNPDANRLQGPAPEVAKRKSISACYYRHVYQISQGLSCGNHVHHALRTHHREGGLQSLGLFKATQVGSPSKASSGTMSNYRSVHWAA